MNMGGIEKAKKKSQLFHFAMDYKQAIITSMSLNKLLSLVWVSTTDDQQLVQDKRHCFSAIFKQSKSTEYLHSGYALSEEETTQRQ
jgi:hypothetical protein